MPLKQLDPELPIPAYAYPGDAGVDLRSTIDLVLHPFERALVPCGIAVSIPRGYAGFVLPRSGLAIRHGVSLVNAPGLIDSGYRGELQSVLVNLDAHKKRCLNTSAPSSMKVSSGFMPQVWNCLQIKAPMNPPWYSYRSNWSKNPCFRRPRSRRRTKRGLRTALRALYLNHQVRRL